VKSNSIQQQQRPASRPGPGKDNLLKEAISQNLAYPRRSRTTYGVGSTHLGCDLLEAGAVTRLEA